MDRKSNLFHLLSRFAFIVIPEAILFLFYLFRGQYVDKEGIPHKTDAALGLAIFSFLFFGLWALYLIIDMLVLFVSKQKAKAIINVYMLIALTLIALVIYLSIKSY